VKVGLLIDTTKCAGCGACTLACKEANGLPSGDAGDAGDAGDVNNANELSATTWTVVEEHEGVHVRRQCMHCQDPACASVCPVAALHKTPEGAVVYDEDKCIGCRYCMMACPFGIPRYEWSKQAPRVRKCVLCYEAATRHGRPTACAAVCPSGATKFGERAGLLAEAETRLRQAPGRYVNHVLGKHEAGGTSVMYLASIAFERLGFRSTVETTPYPQLTWNVLSRLPAVVSTAGVALAGVFWLGRRRQEVAKRERTKNEGKKDGADGREGGR
jgi:formate dehydrogenase iron-sulfur subunit